MMTVRPGVYMPYEAAEDRKAEVRYFDDIVLPESKIEVIESVPASNETDSILSAEVVVVGGRGAESEENFALLKAFADVRCGNRGHKAAGRHRLHSVRASDRTDRIHHPSEDLHLPWSIRAIQHTEGIKDTKLFVAINLDEGAPIFNVSDYGIIGDMKEVLEST